MKNDIINQIFNSKGYLNESNVWAMKSIPSHLYLSTHLKRSLFQPVVKEPVMYPFLSHLNKYRENRNRTLKRDL